MMTVQILVNGKIIDSVEIINRGPVDGVYVGDDEPGGDGERRYEWRLATSTQGKHRGEVRQFRPSLLSVTRCGWWLACVGRCRVLRLG